MKRYLSLLLLAFVFLSGCTVKNGGAPTQMQVEAKRDQLAELSRSKTVSIVEQPYLGAKPIVRESGEEIPVLGKNVTLKQEGTLSEIAASLCTLAPLSAQVAEADGEDVRPAKPAASESPLDDLGLPPLTTSHGGAGQIAVSYTGSLRGLLDTIASLSGYGWDYDAKTNRVTFSATQVRTYTLMAAPGVITYDILTLPYYITSFLTRLYIFCIFCIVSQMIHNYMLIRGIALINYIILHKYINSFSDRLFF